MGVDMVAGGVGPLGVIGILLLLLVGLGWFVVASAVAVKGGPVEQPNRLAQLYGYTVCLVALIVALTTTAALLNAAIDRANPLQSEYSFGTSLTSFEAYKATYERERRMLDRSEPGAADTPTDAELRERYDALVSDRLAATRYRVSKTFVTSGILLVLSVLLFLLHWRWVRRLGEAGTP